MTLQLEKYDLLPAKIKGEIEEDQPVLPFPSTTSSTLSSKPSKTNENENDKKDCDELVVLVSESNACSVTKGLEIGAISTLKTSKNEFKTPSYYRPLSGLFYAFSSLLYVLANKVVLTNYQ